MFLQIQWHPIVSLLPLSSTQVDIGQGTMPAGFYVQRSYGLFPAPWPQDSPDVSRVCKLFELLGLFVAKCIQDGRRVDLPLSSPLFKLMCTPTNIAEEAQQNGDGNQAHQGSNKNLELGPSWHRQQQQQQVSNRKSQSPIPIPGPQSLNPTSTGDEVIIDTEEASSKEAELLLTASDSEEISKDGNGKDEVVLEELPEEGQSEVPWFSGILDSEDLATINPFRAKFLNQVSMCTHGYTSLMWQIS